MAQRVGKLDFIPPSLTVQALEGCNIYAACALAEKVGARLIEGELIGDDSSLIVRYSPSGVSLAHGNMELTGDFSRLAPRISPNRLGSELVVKAAGSISRYGEAAHVVDATAGLGEDSFLLAARGFEVDLYERNPVVAELLRDAILRASSDPRLSNVVSRMHFHEEDSILALPNLSENPNVVLLDPMFPAKGKSSLAKKKLQLLQMLERPCEDEAELFQAAMAVKPDRVVVKRPDKGPWLAGEKPSFSIQGKTVRFDCYVR
ncbi:MAG: class I SAM-dependent methyltransferase [Coriobacteriales bacterium]|jgi:16S rRNA (guanine1516-N2)-methyltransferase